MRLISSLCASVLLTISSLLAIPLIASAGGGGSACQADGVPVANAYIADLTGAAPHTTGLSAAYSEGCGDEIVDYQWDFGDGSTGTGQTAEHTFSAGTWNITLTVTDQAGLSDTGTTSLDVRANNAAPVAGDDAFTFPNYGNSAPWTFSINDNDSDADGDSLTYRVVTSTEHGQLYLGNGHFFYTPVAGYYGPDSFTYEVDDNYGGVSTVATVSLTLTNPNSPPPPQNSAPVATNDTVSTNEDEIVTFNVLSNDTDSEGTLSQTTIVTNTAHGTIASLGNGSYRYTPSANFYGTDSFTYRVTDDGGLTSEATVFITVNSVNDGPAAQFSYTTSKPRNVYFTNQSSDLEGEALSYSWNFGDGTSSTAANPSHSYARKGTFTVTLTITDSSGATATIAKTVTL